MAIHKYKCRCGDYTNNLKSYFIDNIRITVCDKCDSGIKSIPNVVCLDYEEVKKDASKQIIDTREK